MSSPWTGVSDRFSSKPCFCDYKKNSWSRLGYLSSVLLLRLVSLFHMQCKRSHLMFKISERSVHDELRPQKKFATGDGTRFWVWQINMSKTN